MPPASRDVPVGSAAALRLAMLLAARLCHDLGGPLGTIAGTASLLAEGGTTGQDARTLLGDTAVSLVWRLRLLRAAWAGAGEPLAIGDVTRLVGGLRTHGVRVEIDGLIDRGPIDEAPARVLLNVLLLAHEALPRGGVIGLMGDTRAEILVRVAGEGAAWPPGLAAALADPHAAWALAGDAEADGGRSLQAPLTALIAQTLCVPLSMPIAVGAVALAPILIDVRSKT